jgi:hypothetical protein
VAARVKRPLSPLGFPPTPHAPPCPRWPASRTSLRRQNRSGSGLEAKVQGPGLVETRPREIVTSEHRAVGQSLPPRRRSSAAPAAHPVRQRAVRSASNPLRLHGSDLQRTALRSTGCSPSSSRRRSLAPFRPPTSCVPRSHTWNLLRQFRQTKSCPGSRPFKRTPSSKSWPRSPEVLPAGTTSKKHLRRESPAPWTGCVHPRTILISCVAPSSTSGISARHRLGVPSRSLSACLSTSADTTPRLTPPRFSTRIS